LLANRTMSAFFIMCQESAERERERAIVLLQLASFFKAPLEWTAIEM